MLDADVRLERLEIDNLHHFVLHGTHVRHVRWEPRLERLSIERFAVEASIREALSGRYRSFAVDGVDVRLAPSVEPSSPPPESELRVREIDLCRGRIVAASAAGETRLEFSAKLANWGSEPVGDVSLSAERFDLSPVLGIFRGAVPQREVMQAQAVADALRVDIRLPGAREPLSVTAGASRLRLQFGERGVELRRPRLEATAVQDSRADALRLQVHPIAAGLGSALLNAELDQETYALRSATAELNGMEIETLLEAGDLLPDRWTAEGRADLSVRTHDGRSFDYDLGARLVRLELPLTNGSLLGQEIQATSRGTWHRSPEAAESTALAYEIDATLGALRIASAAAELSASGSRIVSAGSLDTTGSGLVRARVSLARGHGRHETGPLPAGLFPISVSLDGRLDLAGAPSVQGTTELVSPMVGRLRARGRTVLDRERPAAAWRWDWSEAPDLVSLRRSIAQLGFGPSTYEVDFQGRPSASGRLEGLLVDPEVQGQLTIAELELAPSADPPIDRQGTWRLDQARASARFSRGAGDRGGIGFEDLKVDGDVSFDAGNRDPGQTWRSPLAVRATGRLDARTAELQVDDAGIELQRLGTSQIAGRIEADRSARLTIHVEPAELAALRELSHLWIEDPAPDFTVQGKVASRLDVRRTGDGLWQIAGELDLVGAGFGSGDGAHVVDGAKANCTVELSSRHDGGIEGQATAVLTGPVILWGTLFGDYSPLTSDLVLKANTGDGGWESSVEWRLPHGVDLGGRLSGERGPGAEPAVDGDAPRRVDYAVSVDVSDLSAFLDHYVRTPFAGSVERIDTLGAGGRLRVELQGALGRARRSLEGTLEATGASFSGVDGATRVGGLDLDLPIFLSWQRDPDGTFAIEPGSERSGSLRYERLLLGGLEFPALDTRLTAAGDTIRLDRPLQLSVLDGHLELQRVALAEWSRPQRDLRFGVRFDELSLAALTRELGTFPLDGALNGTFPLVRLTPDRLQVDGGGTIEIFGGEVAIYDISGRDVLSRFPKLTFSARFEEIHLLDVTRTFDFGDVSGVVNGEIRDCELFRGVPVRCEAALGSVKRKGVRRKISVKAIENISILGAGPRVGILDRGLQKFFDSYNYSRLGFTMKLDQDRFLLRGTERRGQRELFVKGRMPFRIDIVNAAPGQTVSFRTMMSRLGNLQVAAPAKRVRKPAPSP